MDTEKVTGFEVVVAVGLEEERRGGAVDPPGRMAMAAAEVEVVVGAVVKDERRRDVVIEEEKRGGTVDASGRKAMAMAEQFYGSGGRRSSPATARAHRSVMDMDRAITVEASSRESRR